MFYRDLLVLRGRSDILGLEVLRQVFLILIGHSSTHNDLSLVSGFCSSVVVRCNSFCLWHFPRSETETAPWQYFWYFPEAESSELYSRLPKFRKVGYLDSILGIKDNFWDKFFWPQCKAKQVIHLNVMRIRFLIIMLYYITLEIRLLEDSLSLWNYMKMNFWINHD